MDKELQSLEQIPRQACQSFDGPITLYKQRRQETNQPAAVL